MFGWLGHTRIRERILHLEARDRQHRDELGQSTLDARLTELEERSESSDKLVSLVRKHEKTLAAWAPDKVLAIGIAARLCSSGTPEEKLKYAAAVQAFLEDGEK